MAKTYSLAAEKQAEQARIDGLRAEMEAEQRRIDEVSAEIRKIIDRHQREAEAEAAPLMEILLDLERHRRFMRPANLGIALQFLKPDAFPTATEMAIRRRDADERILGA